MSKVVVLLGQLQQLDIKLWVEGDRLRYDAPAGVLSPELRAELVSHKQDLLSFLRQVTQENKPQSINLAPRNQLIPLSIQQQQLWFLDYAADTDVAKNAVAYNMSGGVILTGVLLSSILTQAVKLLIQRHEVLRTCFPLTEAGPAQQILPTLASSIDIVDIQTTPTQQQFQKVQAFAIAEANRPFTLATGPLFRLKLVVQNAQSHVLLVTFHHIIADGWSISIFIQELATLYTELIQQQARNYSGKILSQQRLDSQIGLPSLPIQYADYAVWQRQWLQGPEATHQLNYWQQLLASMPELLTLPTDFPRPANQSFVGDIYSFNLSSTLTQKLYHLAHRTGTTLFTVLLSAYQILLYRWSGQTDLVIGTDVAGRNRTQLEELIGFFVNVLPLRTQLSGTLVYEDFLQKVAHIVRSAFDAQDIPFGKLVDALQVKRNPSYGPLVQVLFVLQNVPIPQPHLPDLKLEALETNNKTSKFDLALFLEEKNGSLIGHWNYSTNLFKPETIAYLSRSFDVLLESIVTQPMDSLDKLPMLTAADQQQQVQKKRQRLSKKRKQLRTVRRQKVALSDTAAVTMAPLRPDSSLPLVIQPVTVDFNGPEWAEDKRSSITEKLLEHGALLFKGFKISSLETFEQLAVALCPDLAKNYSDLPREQDRDRVFGATPYPADKAILFHNESSHLHQWPMKQFFCCLKTAETGGETPLVDCRRIYQQLAPDIRSAFQEKGLLYVRNFIEGLDVSWQDFFHTTDRTVVADYCQKAGIDYEWGENNRLTTRKRCAAVTQHPQTGDMVFFNQIQLHHVSCLTEQEQTSLRSVFQPDQLPRNVYYGDGTPIEEATVKYICELYEQVAVKFPWQTGDVLMLDNMLTAHGRYPFSGERKIVVAMGDLFHQGRVKWN